MLLVLILSLTHALSLIATITGALTRKANTIANNSYLYDKCAFLWLTIIKLHTYPKKKMDRALIVFNLKNI